MRDHTSSLTATVLILDRAGKKNGNNCSNWNYGGCVSRAECTAITWPGAKPPHQHCCSCSMGLQRSRSKQDSGVFHLWLKWLFTRKKTWYLPKSEDWSKAPSWGAELLPTLAPNSKEIWCSLTEIFPAWIVDRHSFDHLGEGNSRLLQMKSRLQKS